MTKVNYMPSATLSICISSISLEISGGSSCVYPQITNEETEAHGSQTEIMLFLRGWAGGGDGGTQAIWYQVCTLTPSMPHLD